MSGSSTSAKSRSSVLLGEGRRERLADREGGERLEARPVGRRQPRRRRRQDEVEPLGDDIGDRLAPERRVEQVGGDLGVEARPGPAPRPGPSAKRATRSGLTSWATRGRRALRTAERVRGPRRRP